MDLQKKRIKLFTHTDLDGYASYIIARYYFKKKNISCDFCNYNNVDNRIEGFLNHVKIPMDYVFITDIAMQNEEIAKKIDICDILFQEINVKLLDHHKPSLWLNEYPFARVKIEENNELICGSMLFYEYLTNDLHFPKNDTLEQWLKIVNDYDTWLWETKYHYDLPNQWNELFFIYDKDMFVENVLEKIKKNDLSFNKTDKLLLDIEHNKKDAYIKSRIKSVIERKIDGYQCVIVFAEQYLNDILTKMYEEYPNSEIQIAITGRNVSYRVRNENLNIDLNEFSKKFGGGGHEKAAGSTISDEIRNQYLDMIFKENEKRS